MNQQSMRQYGFGLGALAGIALAMLANKSRKSVTDYAVQSGERRKQSAKAMERRDEDVFREEVEAENR